MVQEVALMNESRFEMAKYKDERIKEVIDLVRLVLAALSV